MQLLDGRLLLAATDLNEFLLCRHLVSLNLAALRGAITPPDTQDEHAKLIARKGDEHERKYLDSLRATSRDILEIPRPHGFAEIDAAAQATHEAMRAGAEIIYQAALFDGDWLGYADFLHRVDRPSALGPWSYEVEDTKLAHRTKAYFLLQLCAYSEHVARLQGAEPERMHVVLGTNERESFRRADFAAYYRRVRTRLDEFIGSGANSTYPNPVEHCAVCSWAPHCDARREADDHLSLVAGMRREQTAQLVADGVTTLTALARLDPADATVRKLSLQARLQLHHRQHGTHRYELLEPVSDRGFALLPAPAPGDVFLDLEGDPLVEGGLEYLFGVGWEEGGEWKFQPYWAHTPDDERRAFEQVIDFVMERLGRDPEMHVYHYAHYEPAALKRLAGRCGTREDALDRLLRGKVFTDLFTVVRQALRVSQPSYSLKKLEVFYRTEARAQGITDGNESIVAYERWVERHDDTLLRDIERYNADDVRSTCELRTWLLGLRDEAIRTFGRDIPWRRPEDGAPSPKVAVQNATTAALAQRLGDGLMAHLLDYHQREDRPAWWAHFDRCAKDPEELVDDADAIGDLTPDPSGRRSPGVVRLRFPPQEHKLRAGMKVLDPATAQAAGTIVTLNDDEGWLDLGGAGRGPAPRALIPGKPIETKAQRAALQRLGSTIADGGLTGPGAYRAVREVLAGAPPRIAGIPAGGAVQCGAPTQLAIALDESHLFVQGPPGSGKTYTGAEVVVHLLAQGRTVGVAALSHKAIHNLLHEIEEAGVRAKVRFRGLKKASGGYPESHFESKLKHSFVVNSTDNKDFPPAQAQLVAGTAWLFPRAAMDDALDYLVIDEAGQMSLADALAMGTAARNLILLGDPQQLPQVSQGVHPDGSGRSVLEHLLGDRETVAADRGLFLEQTRRMHPDVCGFISELSYEGRLGWIDACARQRVEAPGALTGTGIRYLSVAHEGNSQSSREEAECVAAAIESLVQGHVVDQQGKRRQLTYADVMVVAPYNAHVRCLRQRLPADVRVGTVDKFQGQEAPIVFFSMATSSGGDLPRRLEFLFSRNRLNVAISRAQCLAVLVASPRLLDVHCRTVEQMRMVNGVCRLVEVATPTRVP